LELISTQLSWQIKNFMFDFSKAQQITDQMIKLQNELKFKEAANLYLKTVREIKASRIRGNNDLEWISNILDQETIQILLEEN
jgi:hypothetical protein